MRNLEVTKRRGGDKLIILYFFAKIRIIIEKNKITMLFYLNRLDNFKENYLSLQCDC